MTTAFEALALDRNQDVQQGIRTYWLMSTQTFAVVPFRELHQINQIMNEHSSRSARAPLGGVQERKCYQYPAVEVDCCSLTGSSIMWLIWAAASEIRI